MKTLVISYSFTGNNEALASSVAKELGAQHIKITEPKSRKVGAIFTDLIFKKTPSVQPEPAVMNGYDLIIVSGPVWIGQAATPLRAYLKHMKANTCGYAYVSISGGADGQNPKLAGDLKKWTGREPAAVIDLHIADLLDIEKPTRKDTMAYRINEADLKQLTSAAVKAVREAV